MQRKKIIFTTDIESSIREADMIFLSVNTPTKTKGIGAGKASDLRWIEASARQIAEFSSSYYCRRKYFTSKNSRNY